MVGLQVREADGLGAGRIEPGRGRRFVIGDPHGGGPGGGGLGGLGDHEGDDLPGIGDRIGLERPVRGVDVAAGHQVRHGGDVAGALAMGEHGEHARHRLRGGEIEPDDPPPAMVLVTRAAWAIAAPVSRRGVSEA